jgi:hypothetical protein
MDCHPGATPGMSAHREVVARLQHVLIALLNLAADVQQECAVDGVDDAHAVDDVEGGGDRLALTRPGGVYGGVAQQRALGDLDKGRPHR